MPERKDNNLAKNVKDLVAAVQPVTIAYNRANARKENRTQQSIDTNLSKLIKEQKQSNKIQLKTMFAQKESPFVQLQENTERTNDILKDLVDKSDKEGKGLFDFVDILKTGLFAAAPTIAAGLGVALASAFTAKMFGGLANSIADWMEAAVQANLKKRKVTRDTKQIMDKRLDEMVDAGEMTQRGRERGKELTKETKDIIDSMYKTEENVLLQTAKGTAEVVWNTLIGNPLSYFSDKMGLDKVRPFLYNTKKGLLYGENEAAKKAGVYDPTAQPEENMDRVYEALNWKAFELGKTFKEGDRVSGEASTKMDLGSSTKELNRFEKEVVKVANRIGIKPSVLMGIMEFESNLNPAEVNPRSGATGLIQFIPAVAKELGTSLKEIKTMDRVEQLRLVEDYFNLQIKRRGPIETMSDAYMAVFNPSKVGASEDADVYKRGTKAYEQNIELDIDNDGIISKYEAAGKVRSRVAKHLALDQSRTVQANTPAGIIPNFVNPLQQKLDQLINVFTEANFGKMLEKSFKNAMPKAQSGSVNFVVGGRG